MIDYVGLVGNRPAHERYKSLVGFLSNELPQVWFNEYAVANVRPTNVVRVAIGEFQYLFDLYTELEEKGEVNAHPFEDSRLVAVFGRSAPSARPRENSRLKGWIGPTGKYLGADSDKGHFIAHTAGGGIDGAEINLFVQARQLNRGWSERGKVYREMEAYCAKGSGTFCFHRPLYVDGTCRPAQCEFGVLKKDSTLWVEVFDN